MTDDLWAQAIAEAYAAAPAGDPVLDTLEFQHASFLDENGAPDSVRLVRDYGIKLLDGDPDVYGFNLKLEDDAPMFAGETKPFVSCMFAFEFPAQQEGNLPEMQVRVANVTRLISDRLDAAVIQRTPITMVYRSYILTEPEPQLKIRGMTIRSVTSNAIEVVATAGFVDLINTNFPKLLYRATEFRGLRA